MVGGLEERGNLYKEGGGGGGTAYTLSVLMSFKIKDQRIPQNFSEKPENFLANTDFGMLQKRLIFQIANEIYIYA